MKEIGITSSSTTLNNVLKGCFATFSGTNDIFLYNQGTLTTGITDLPIGYGLLEVIKFRGRWKILYYNAEYMWISTDNDTGIVNKKATDLTKIARTRNNLTASSYVDGEALSAYQGYILNQNLLNYNNYMTRRIAVIHGNDANNTDYTRFNLWFDSDSGHISFLYTDWDESTIIVLNTGNLSSTLTSNNIRYTKIREDNNRIINIQAARVENTSTRMRLKISSSLGFGSFDILVLAGKIENLNLELSEG